jgi:hypothetical protein
VQKKWGIPPVTIADQALLGLDAKGFELAACRLVIPVEPFPLAADGSTPLARIIHKP